MFDRLKKIKKLRKNLTGNIKKIDRLCKSIK